VLQSSSASTNLKNKIHLVDKNTKSLTGKKTFTHLFTLIKAIARFAGSMASEGSSSMALE
jgi:hypothetical protein